MIATGADLWHALDQLAGTDDAEHRAFMHRLGKGWGRRWTERVDGWVQQRHGRTLRELELHAALEALSGSIGALGLGRFDVDLGQRDRGVLLVLHRHSPFDSLLAARDAGRHDLLAGLHAGFFSYLSGRDLEARVVGVGDGLVKIAAATSPRLEHLFATDPTPEDARWLARHGAVELAAHG